MSYIHRITTENEADSGDFYESGVIDARDWELIPSRKLKLNYDRYSITAGKDLRVEGQGRQDTVSSDADVIKLPTDWLVQKAITFLPEVKILSNKLDRTYAKAMDYVARYSLSGYPNPWARKVVE